MNNAHSPRWTLIKHDLRKIAIGAGIALLGSLATYLQTAIPSIDFGNYTAIAVAINSIIVNAIRKFIITSNY